MLGGITVQQPDTWFDPFDLIYRQVVCVVEEHDTLVALVDQVHPIVFEALHHDLVADFVKDFRVIPFLFAYV